MTSGKTALIIGGGIGGLCTAIALERIGWEVKVFESAAALRADGTGLSIMANAVSALKAIGADGPVLDAGMEINSFAFKTADGQVITEIPLKKVATQLNSKNINIHRGRLLQALSAQLKTGTVHTGKSCTGFSQSADRATAFFQDGSSAEGDLLIGADGLHSAIRKQLLGDTPLRSTPYIAWLAVHPFQHAAFTPGYVAHYWGRGKRFGLIDIGHGESYWWGTCNTEEQNEGSPLVEKRDIENCYQGWATEVTEIIRETPVEKIIKVRTRDRTPVKRWVDGRVALLGDAAHPMLTSLGQGAAQSIEDAVILSHCLATTPAIETALLQYQHIRLPKANAVVNLARNISVIEQLENPILCALRNFYFRISSQSKLEAQNAQILRFAHEEWNQTG